MEYARHVLGLTDADHEETAPDAPSLVISRLACSLVGKTEIVQIFPTTSTHQAYGQGEATEQFRCNFGLNAKYVSSFSNRPLKVAGVDREGEVRVVELSGHPFFVATLFLPQLSSQPGTPHPLVVAYLRAAIVFRNCGGGAV